MWATSAQATALAMVASKSFASRRQRPSHAKVRSTTHRRGRLRSPGGVGTFDDLDRPFADALQGRGAVSRRHSHRRRRCGAARDSASGSQQGRRGAVAVLNVGFVHDEPDQVALSVGDDVALAAFDFLSGVIAAWAAAFGGFQRLAVDDAGRRARLSAGRLARRHHEGVVERGKDTAARPGVEITLHRRVGGKSLGNCRHWQPVDAM